ncbi:MAG: hypothetical protein ABMB14_33530, partial [Myxococcota bacterium]
GRPEPTPAAPSPGSDGDDHDGGPSLLPKLERSAGEPRPADCALDIAGMKPVLDGSQPGAAKPPKVRRETNRLIERVRYDDGTELRIVRAGCAHIGETWEVAPVDGGGDLVATAIAALGRAKTAYPPTWTMSLQPGVTVGADGSIPCGDANCALKLDGRVLTFSYDFAL